MVSRLCLAVLALLAAASATAASHYEPWYIVSASDWHSAEGGVTSPDPADFTANQASEVRLIKGTLFCQPDVVLISGDVGSGHWTEGALKKAGVLLPGESIEAAITRLGSKVYTAMKNNFAEAGVERLLVAVGDHGIGDNDWAPGSERAVCVPYHRAVFGRSFNMDAGGQWHWPETVCGVPARPLATKYAGTSFAYRHKNVLFVTLDIFRQEGAGDKLHPRHGSVSPEIEGAHLAWFQQVLAAGRRDTEVRYIFVQAHTPVLPPVRAQSSSMMMAAGYADSALWRAMREAQVDLYFAGEVHATTLTKDPESSVVQLVTDRNMPARITVCDDKLILQTFDRSLQDGGSLRDQPLYEAHQVSILKKNGQCMLTGGKGVLKPLDTRALFIHYPFEKIAATPFGREKGGAAPNVLNHGELDATYDARTRNTRLADGKLGEGLAFEPGAYLEVHGTGPFGLFGDTARTFALWFKTTGAGNYNLVCGGSGIEGKSSAESGFMDLVLQDGILVVRTSAGESRTTAANLNDGQWHHAALAVQPQAARLAQITAYADGQPVAWAFPADANQPIKAAMGIHGLSLGGAPRPVWASSQRAKGVPVFDGVLDDFAAWYRALSEDEIALLYTSAAEGLDASGADARMR